MKNSFDYFKTLKEMSRCVYDSFSSLPDGSQENKIDVRFLGLRWEISSNLIDEFVAPVERNDIYNLLRCVDSEMWQIGKIQRITHNFTSPQKEDILSLFSLQADLMGRLSELKLYHKYINEVKSCSNNVYKTKIDLCKKINLSFESNSKPLLKYVYYSYHLELVELIGQTFSSIENVLVNNT